MEKDRLEIAFPLLVAIYRGLGAIPDRQMATRAIDAALYSADVLLRQPGGTLHKPETAEERTDRRWALRHAADQLRRMAARDEEEGQTMLPHNHRIAASRLEAALQKEEENG